MITKRKKNSRTRKTATSIILNGQRLEKVDHFKYFGSTPSKDGSSTKEVKTRLSLAWKSSLPGPSNSAASSQSFLNDIPLSPPLRTPGLTLPKDLSSPLPSGVTPTDVKVLTPLEQIMKEQRNIRKLIESHITSQPVSGAPGNPSLPEGVVLPLLTIEDIEIFDPDLVDSSNTNSVIQYLALIGGETTKEVVRRVLSHLMDSSLVVQFTWQGMPQKKAFQSLLLSNVLKKVVWQNSLTRSATDKEVDFAVREFFRTASDRNGGRARRAEKRISASDN